MGSPPCAAALLVVLSMISLGNATFLGGIFGSRSTSAETASVVSPINAPAEHQHHELIELLASKQHTRDNPFRIVLVGASGAGKTALLDLLCNMAHTDPFGIIGKPDWKQFRQYHVEQNENSVNTEGLSMTKSSTTYTLEFGHGGVIEVIDTPGLTSRMGRDQENVDNILEHLKSIRYINMIVMVEAPSPRDTYLHRYVSGAIDRMIPKNASNNVVALFTSSYQLASIHKECKAMAKATKRTHIHAVYNPMSLVVNLREMTSRPGPEDIAVFDNYAPRAARSMLAMLANGVRDLNPIDTTTFSILRHDRDRIESELAHIRDVIVPEDNLIQVHCDRAVLIKALARLPHLLDQYETVAMMSTFERLLYNVEEMLTELMMLASTSEADFNLLNVQLADVKQRILVVLIWKQDIMQERFMFMLGTQPPVSELERRRNESQLVFRSVSAPSEPQPTSVLTEEPVHLPSNSSNVLTAPSSERTSGFSTQSPSLVLDPEEHNKKIVAVPAHEPSSNERSEPAPIPGPVSTVIANSAQSAPTSGASTTAFGRFMTAALWIPCPLLFMLL